MQVANEMFNVYVVSHYNTETKGTKIIAVFTSEETAERFVEVLRPVRPQDRYTVAKSALDAHASVLNKGLCPFHVRQNAQFTYRCDGTCGLESPIDNNLGRLVWAVDEQSAISDAQNGDNSVPIPKPRYIRCAASD